ncbi:MAG: hypothetical protein B6D39_08485 [Anaerolineae bacterium UTCFX2]|nr:MAG: hypothetical protein B6D39_08485 [Anaerolineae bacterium UTCFX2]
MTVSPGALLANGIWLAVWKLLRLRLLIFQRTFRRASLKKKLFWGLMGLSVTAALGFLLYLSWSLLRFLQSPELVEILGDPQPLFASLPALIVSAVFVGILFTSFGVLLQALYLAGDMDFLLSTPIPIRSVFIAKLLQAILPNFGLICLFVLPVLYGMGFSSGYHFLFYPAVLVLLFALALAAAGIASVLVMAVVRLFPARRVAEILGFVGAILTILCSQSGQLANMQAVNPQQARQALQMLTRFNNPWSPFTWAGAGLVRLGEMRWLSGIAITLLVVGGSLAVFRVALTAAERLYYTGWANMRAVTHKKKAAPKAPTTAVGRSRLALGERLSAVPVLALIHKDFLTLRRDMRNMSQLITPLIFGVIYAVMLLRGTGDVTAPAETAPVWLAGSLQNLRLYSNIFLSLVVGWMMLSRLGGMGFAQEGPRFWLLKSAPLSVKQLIAAKYFVAYLPALGACWIFLVATWALYRPDLQDLIFALLIGTLVLAGNTGVQLTFGIVGANMAWEDPRQMQKSAAGCVGGLVTAAYQAVSLGLFLGPGILLAMLHYSAGVGRLLGLLLGGAFSLACAVVPLWLARGRVERLGEA